MDGETLAKDTVKGINDALGRSVLTMMFGPANVLLLKAHKDYWAQASESDKTRLLASWQSVRGRDNESQLPPQ